MLRVMYWNYKISILLIYITIELQSAINQISQQDLNNSQQTYQSQTKKLSRGEEAEPRQ